MSIGIAIFLAVLAVFVIWMMWAIASRCGGDDEQD